MFVFVKSMFFCVLLGAAFLRSLLCGGSLPCVVVFAGVLGDFA